MERRQSKKRDKILELLKKEHGALSARDIHTKLPSLDLSTIYRNLDFFVSEGDVQKLLLDSSEALYEYKKQPHHHAVCTTCSRIIHFDAPSKKIEKILDLKNFKVDDLEVTVRGECPHK